MPTRRTDRMYRIRRRYLPRRRRKWVRFYGKFQTKTGKMKAFEFQVRIASNLTGKGVYHHVINTVNTMKYQHLMPIHKRRETFPTFRAMNATPHAKIRRILDYDVTTEVNVDFS
jgi:hypothetical protein